MRIDVITIFPQLLQSILGSSIIGRAQSKSLVEINIHDLRNYSNNKHRKIDDYPYGGGSGMVMKIEPFVNGIEDLSKSITYDEIILLAADGDTLTQQVANELSLKNNLMFLCGHYKGVDDRLIQNFITREISIGDYVLTGGELPACVVIDSIVRLLPGVLSDEESALNDSFQYGLLHEPIYTRPADFRGMKVPDVLLSGDQKKINEWRLSEAIKRTKIKRPDYLQE